MADNSLQTPDTSKSNSSDVWKDDPYYATVKVDTIMAHDTFPWRQMHH